MNFKLLQDLCACYGTPFFVYHPTQLQHNITTFRDTWKHYFPTGNIYISYKTNYLPEVCRAASELGLAVDVVSDYELEHALKMAPNSSIIFNGPFKSDAELRYAVEAGALVNIDCVEECDVLAKINMDNQPLAVGLRVNPAMPFYGSQDPSFVAAHKHQVKLPKFGWPLTESKLVAMEVRK